MGNKTAKSNLEFKQPLGLPGTRRLLAHARHLEAVREAIARQLPGDLAEGWQLARCGADALVLTTDSAARATRLRYSRKRLLDAMEQALGMRAQHLTVKILPPAPLRQDPPRRAQLSPAAAEVLRQTAQTMEDGALRRALVRLAQRARNDAND